MSENQTECTCPSCCHYEAVNEAIAAENQRRADLGLKARITRNPVES